MMPSLQLPRYTPIGLAKFDPSQPRDEHGRWFNGGGVDMVNIDHSLDQLNSGMHIDVDRKDVIPLLRRADERGLTTANVANMHVNGMTLFDAPNKGFSRADMPQVPTDRKAEFLDEMAKHGVKVTRESVDPTTLRPCQNEMGAEKSGGILGREMKKNVSADDVSDRERLTVSNDGYVLDGHHRWVAFSAMNLEDPSVRLPVLKVDMGIDQLLLTVAAWNEREGIQGLALGQDRNTYKLLKAAAERKFLAAIARGLVKYSPDQHRDGHGRWTDEGTTIETSYPVHTSDTSREFLETHCSGVYYRYRGAEQPNRGLTKAQEAALHQYTASSDTINGGIRTGTFTKDARLLRNAVASNTVDSPVTVFHGVADYPTAARIAKMSEGDTFGVGKFVSTSPVKEVAQEFSNGMILRIDLDAGSHCVAVPGSEDEIILQANSKFEFVGLDAPNVAHVRYIGAPMDKEDMKALTKSDLSDERSRFALYEDEIQFSIASKVYKYNPDQPRDYYGRWTSSAGDRSADHGGKGFRPGTIHIAGTPPEMTDEPTDGKIVNVSEYGHLVSPYTLAQRTAKNVAYNNALASLEEDERDKLNSFMQYWIIESSHARVSRSVMEEVDPLLREMPKVDGLVYRGYGKPWQTAGNFPDKAQSEWWGGQVGKTLDFQSPSSVSLDPRTGATFGPVLLEINATGNRAAMTENIAESEAILGTGRYTITDVRMQDVGVEGVLRAVVHLEPQNHFTGTGWDVGDKVTSSQYSGQIHPDTVFIDGTAIPKNIKQAHKLLKYSEDEARDDHGRWTSLAESLVGKTISDVHGELPSMQDGFHDKNLVRVDKAGHLMPVLSPEYVETLRKQASIQMAYLDSNRAAKVLEDWIGHASDIRLSPNQTKWLDKACKELPKVDSIVYRGTNSPGGHDDKITDLFSAHSLVGSKEDRVDYWQSQVGKTLEFTAPSSTTLDPRVAPSFGDILLEINAKGDRAACLSTSLGREQEAILGTGQYTITSVRTQSLQSFARTSASIVSDAEPTPVGYTVVHLEPIETNTPTSWKVNPDTAASMPASQTDSMFARSTMEIDSEPVPHRLGHPVKKYSQDEPRDDQGRWTSGVVIDGSNSAIGDDVQGFLDAGGTVKKFANPSNEQISQIAKEWDTQYSAALTHADSLDNGLTHTEAVKAINHIESANELFNSAVKEVQNRNEEGNGPKLAFYRADDSNGNLAGFLLTKDSGVNHEYEFCGTLATVPGAGSAVVDAANRDAVAQDKPVWASPLTEAKGFWSKVGLEDTRAGMIDSTHGGAWTMTPDKLRVQYGLEPIERHGNPWWEESDDW